jgi:riboflavin kinase/FMN adenylyltransferase
LLSTFDEKANLLENAGVDHLVVCPFTIDFAELTYDQFIRDILIKKLHLHTLVLGHDHRLGKNREGTYNNIVTLAQKLNFKVAKIDTFLIDNIDISSSKIRSALQKGEVEKANNFLGYSYSLKGSVVEGNMIGRGIGFPTANILLGDHYKLIPVEGVYAVSVLCDGEMYQGMLNIGFRPTIEMNADHRTIEVNIFKFERDIYQKEITIYFHHWIRSEHKFGSIEELKKQLEIDRIQIEELLS